MLPEDWEAFKDTLPHQAGVFAKRNWGTPLHSLCSYQGKLKPALAHKLVMSLSKPGDRVFDPFSGSGTVPLEAAINRRVPLANDLSTIAVAITTAKIGATTRRGCDAILDDLGSYLACNEPTEKTLQDAKEVSFNKSISEYFHEKTFREVLLARDYFISRRDLSDANWCLVFSSMLHILHGNRPYALSRRSHPLTPYAPTGDFIEKCVVSHLATKVSSSLSAKEKLPLSDFGNCEQLDVRKIAELGEGYCDLILTSPPFASSTRFYMTNWMRFWFAGWGLLDFKNAERDFVESKRNKDLRVYYEIFENFAKVLGGGGLAVLHVGKNRAVDMAGVLRKFEFPKFKLVDHFIEDVSAGEKHGIKDKGGTIEHQYLIYERL
jgi:hypothetical protein